MKKLSTALLIYLTTISLLFAITANTGKFDQLTTNDSSLTKIDVKKNIDVQTTGGIYLPSGTTGQRPTPIKEGMLRFNSTDTTVEVYSAGAWGAIGGGAAKATLGGDLLGAATSVGTKDAYSFFLKTNDTNRLFVSDTGIVTVGGDTSSFSSSPNTFGTYNFQTTDTANAFNVFDNYFSYYGSSSSSKNGTIFRMSLRPGDVSFTYSGDNNTLLADGYVSQPGKVNTFRGLKAAVASSNSTATIGEAAAMSATVSQAQGIIEIAKGLDVSRIEAKGTGVTAHTAVGVDVGTDSIVASGSSTSNTAIGLRINNNISSADTSPVNYAIKSDSTAQSSFAGAVGIGGTPAVSNLLTVTSTTKASRPCPVMTSTQRDAVSSPGAGDCIHNSTTSKLNVYDGSVWKAVGGGVDSWATTTAYLIGDLVIESNRLYKALTNHTSGTFATDLGASRWQEIAGQENLTGDVTSVGNVTTLTNAPVIAKVLTGYVSGAGTVTATDSILQAIQKLNGNNATNANLTGPITSLGNATSVAAQTGTGSTFVMNTSPTLVTPILGAATHTSLTGPLAIGGTTASSTLTLKSTTGVGTTDALIFQVGNNGGTEAMRATTAGNIGIGTTSPSATTILDVASTTKGSRPAPSMTTAQMNAIASPLAGMQVFNTDLAAVATYNGTSWQYGYGNILQDPGYSAYFTSTGANITKISESRTGWISTSYTTTGQYAFTFAAGNFTSIPSCTVTSDVDTFNTSIQTLTLSGFSVFVKSDAGSFSNNMRQLTVHCNKVGVDATNASAQTFATSNANYDWTSFTPTLSAGFGAPTLTNVCKKARSGSNMLIKCSFTNGVSAASLATITVPDALSIDSAKITAANTTAAAGQVIGKFCQNSAASCGSIVTATGTSSTLLYFTNGFGGLVPSNGTTAFASSVLTDFEISIPISGWLQTGLIVGSFAGYNKAPGADSSSTPNIDSFTVSFGTTAATTVCSATPCSYLDQIGTAVSSITRASAGNYAINTARTYSKFKCISNAYTGAGVYITTGSQVINCANCNNANFNFVNLAGVNADVYGNLFCTGSY